MVRVGIVGLGGMGEVHYKNYEKIDGVEVAAFVSKSERGKEKARELGVPYYRSIKEMAENEDIHVVDICTPNFLHKENVMEALNLGKHVIVEKPMALHKSDAEEMYALAEKKNLKLFVAHVLQFTKEMEILRAYVRSGDLGRPLDGYFLRIAGKPGWSEGGWLFEKEKSGVIPFDLHIHDLDMIVSLFGKPKKYSYTSSGNKGIGYREQYRFIYSYDDLHVGAEAAWYDADFPFTQSFRIYFEKGLLVREKDELILYEKDRGEKKLDITDKVLVSTGINLPPTGMFYNELSHFLECIREGKDSSIVTKEQVLTVIELLEEIVFGEDEEEIRQTREVT